MLWYKISFSPADLKSDKGTQATDEFIKLYSLITSRGSRITQSEMSKQIQAELVDKLSESLGKEYIITQSPSPERQ